MADRIAHNHVTRDIKPVGQCPACDAYCSSGQVATQPVEPWTPATTEHNHPEDGKLQAFGRCVACDQIRYPPS